VAYIQGDRGTGPPNFRPGLSCNSPPPLTRSNAIAGFQSQSPGLPAYTCKTGRSRRLGGERRIECGEGVPLPPEKGYGKGIGPLPRKKEFLLEIAFFDAF